MTHEGPKIAVLGAVRFIYEQGGEAVVESSISHTSHRTFGIQALPNATEIQFVLKGTQDAPELIITRAGSIPSPRL